MDEPGILARGDRTKPAIVFLHAATGASIIGGSSIGAAHESTW